MRARTVVFHTLDHARAALAAAKDAGVSLTLRTAPDAAGYAGVQYLKAIVDRAAGEYPEVPFTAVIDCGEDAGTVQAALRIGWAVVVFSGAAPVRARLADIARRRGAEVIDTDPDAAVLDLLDDPDPAAACRAFLAEAPG